MKGDLGDLTIRVSADKDAKTLTVTDRGIGMTPKRSTNTSTRSLSRSRGVHGEVQEPGDHRAFRTGFLLVVHGGRQVEIITKSWKEGAKTVRWSCTGRPNSKWRRPTRRMTAVRPSSCTCRRCARICRGFESRGLLRKYCRFLPIPIAFGKVKEWKDGKYVDTDKDNVINNVDPLWTRKPPTLPRSNTRSFTTSSTP